MAKKKAVSGKAAPAVPKCNCEHPYQCDCGNRPERISRGHKWDPETQAWVGKGHRQKGASGQVASTAEAAKITRVGQTQISQWQRLPSTLLNEYCKQQGRKPPKFKDVGSSGNHKFRVILPDNKDSNKDLIFVPALPVENEEQAREEACILALLQQTPNLPHERKLPEPYKTTWLSAIENRKAASKSGNQGKKKTTENDGPVLNLPSNDGDKGSNPASTSNSNITGGGAQASKSLALGGAFISKAERQRHMDEKRRAQAKRIRHHEALRAANKNHPVFMAAHLRQQIQKLLRGDVDVDILDEDEDEEESPGDADLDDGQVYVRDRLCSEGFSKRQVRTALQTTSKDGTVVSEDRWDSLYEECLQWLCIHLDEDQLPEGFDPRGGMLDVVVASKGEKQGTKADTNPSVKDQDEEVNLEVQRWAAKYGINKEEAQLVLEQARTNNCDEEMVLWHVLQKAAGISLEASADTSDENTEAAQQEIQALEAIFPNEFRLEKDGDLTVLSIRIAESDVTMRAVMASGVYPSAYPNKLLLCGAWPGSFPVGAAVLVDVIKFMSTLDLGTPMIFEIYGEIQNLFHSISSGQLKPLSLLPALGHVPLNSSEPQPKTEIKPNGQRENLKVQTERTRKPNRRPRERSAFWSTSPTKTRSAVAYPNIPKAMDQARKSLPAYKARNDFLMAVARAEEGGRVVLVTGDTGCGKTTQIPQYILEEAPAASKIVVAQPRRLAATAVAARVASERGENQPGKESVGYVVRGETAMSASSRLVFCTTGVLLRQLQSEGALQNITHIIVDEVHERHIDSDVLLGILKVTLKEIPHLRVILMSATLEADKFALYWGANTPRIHIPGRTFPVSDYMLEDVLELTGYIPPKNKNKKQWQRRQAPRKSTPWNDSEKSDEEDADEYGKGTPELQSGMTSGGHSRSIPLEDLVRRVDETDLDYDMLARLICYLVQNRGPQDDGSILVFLPGAPEINMAMEAVQRAGRNLPVLVLPLHGGLQPKDQRLVFQPTRNRVCKIVLSTNVAETSITIPDCTIVVDSCREKESLYDPVNRMPMLIEQFASKASLKQRRGRAGRVRVGVCYKLISRDTYSKLKEHAVPEIQRCALEQTLLNLLFLGLSLDFMGKLMDPPSTQSVDSALFSLRKLGAVTSNGEGILTPLGMHLAGIPAPPAIGKLLVMGSILGIRRAALAMAAGMSVGRSPFLRVDAPRDLRRNDDKETSIQDMKMQRIIDERKTLFAKVGNSDHSLLVAAYMLWDDTPPGGGDRKQLCASLGLSFNGMRDMAQIVNQYDSSLRAAGYVASEDADKNMKSWTIVRAVAVAALAPSQLVRVKRPTTKYVSTVEGAVEKEGEAKELTFFIRGCVDGKQESAVANIRQEERVFVHPSSFCFSVGNYYCPFLVFNSMVRTSKPFLRDVSECSAYSMLLFGGDLEVRATEGIVVIDDFVKLDAKARIGSLIGGLRQRVDVLLAKKIDDPSFELASTNEMKLIVKLLLSDGHG